MSNGVLVTISTTGSALSAASYFALLVLLALRSRGQGSGRLLLLAVIGEIAFAVGNALAPSPVETGSLIHGMIEALRNIGWIAFMLNLVKAGRGVLLLTIGLMLSPAVADQLAGEAASLPFRVIVAVAALVCLEQVWRGTAPNRRWAMKLVCLGLLSKFAFDLVMYSDALLFGQLDTIWWTTAGYANALLVPLIAVSAARNRDWKLDVNVSRQMVFHSATLLGSAVFLLLVATGGYILKFFGGTPGAVAATMLAFLAVVGLIVVVSSGTVRSTLRVQLAKHFFSYRYDYRHEWLKLTRHLQGSAGAEGRGDAESAALGRRGLNSLMDLVESPGGVLWLKDNDGVFRCVAQLGRSHAVPILRSDDPWTAQVQAHQWIVDLRGGPAAVAFHAEEVRADQATKAAVELPEWLKAHPDAGFMVPLQVEEDLIGIALLHRPRVAIDLDWESRDLLRTAARQVASFLALRRAVEALVQARQFESFNRMSAFVVHDLKNLVAQLSLMMRNSERHKRNPEFQEDMMDTVRNVLQHMQGLLRQLSTGARPVDAPRGVYPSKAIAAAVRSHKTQKPLLRLELDPSLSNLQVMAHQDRLERVLGHLVQNAAEASSDGEGLVLVRSRREASLYVIEIMDRGQGMSEDFIREQLFHPFSSTKAEGMGIGVFESREYIRELSGSIDVVSEKGIGTTFTVRLPISAPSRTSLELGLLGEASASWSDSDQMLQIGHG